MRRGLVALSLLSLMVLAGCLSPTTAGWGMGDGEVKVNFSTDSVTATSSLGDGKVTFDELSPIGCNTVDDSQTLDYGGMPITFTGYMAASNFYTSHDELNGAGDLDLTVTTSVAIKSMSMKEAAAVDGEQIPRVQVKDWTLPLYPETGAGNIDLDEVDMDSDSEWFVLGLIPTSENILNGMQALGEWHQPVQIEGYLLDTNNTTSVGGSVGLFSTMHEINNNCEMKIGTQNMESVYLVVTAINLQDSVVTSSGDSSDEWVLGDVPFLGRSGFITFFLIFGLGGAVGMFILSNIAVSKGASHSMEMLVGKKAMATVSKVKSDMKKAKSEGMTTSRQRNAEARKSAADKIQNDSKKPTKKSKDDSGALVGFDLDSALQSGSNDSTTSEFGSKGSSVVATSEAQSIASQSSSKSRMGAPQKSNPVASSANVSAPTTRSSVISKTDSAPSKRSHFSSAVSGNSTPREEPKKKVVKKRATKKAQQPKAEPWGKQEQSSNTFEEEDDFSDFSL